MKTLAVQLGAQDGSVPAQQSAIPDCPGARLRISRAEFDALVTGGERFTSNRQDIPYDGLGDARVACSAKVEQIPKSTSNDVLFYGLCHSCSGLEADNRHSLRLRVQARSER